MPKGFIHLAPFAVVPRHDFPYVFILKDSENHEIYRNNYGKEYGQPRYRKNYDGRRENKVDKYVFEFVHYVSVLI
jgi:hypothetical protein